jgi:prevent-host-death family protein
MSTVGAFEAKTKLSELLDLVERGEEITITRRGTPVARLVPVAGDVEAAARQRALADEIKASRERSGLKHTTVDEILEWRDAGRRR